MYLDWTYIVLVLPAVLFSLWASAGSTGFFPSILPAEPAGG